MAANAWSVARWMTPDPRTVAPAARVVDAFELMQKYRIRHIPVVEKGKLVGIVSDRDVRRFLPARVQLEHGSASYGVNLLETDVREIMGRKPITVSPEATIREAGELLVREKISALPVLDDEKLVGIVSAEDLLWAFIDRLEDVRGMRDL